MAMVTCNVCGGGLAAAADGLLYCKNCGVSYPMEQIQAALAAQNASLWDWQPTADGGAELLQYKGDAPVVTVPAELGGRPVTALAKGAFYEKKKIARISLPDCVHTIGRLAFCKCLALEEVILPRQLRYIGSDAFTQCHALASPPPSSVGGGHRRRRFQRLRDSGNPGPSPRPPGAAAAHLLRLLQAPYADPPAHLGLDSGQRPVPVRRSNPTPSARNPP